MFQFFLMMMSIACLVVPIVWISMYYDAKKNGKAEFSEEDSMQLGELMEAADSMAERIKTLESILDVETPDWRDKHNEE